MQGERTTAKALGSPATGVRKQVGEVVGDGVAMGREGRLCEAGGEH